MVGQTDISNGAFNKSLTHEYRLSLSLGIDGMAYMVANKAGQVMALRSFPLTGNGNKPLKSLLSSDDKLLLHYKSTKICLESHIFTLIPERLFNSGDRALYLGKSATLRQGDPLGHDRIPFIKSFLVYAWDSEQLALLKNYFPSGQMFHRVGSLIQGWHKQAEVREGRKFFLDVAQKYFTISFFEDDSLIFCNRFYYKTVGDFIYYTLLAYQRFGLSPEETPCIISGQIKQDSQVFQKLYSYIRHIQFMPMTPFYSFPKTARFDHYHFLDLYSLKLCES